MKHVPRDEPGHLLPCLLRLRELGFAEVWCRDEPEPRTDIDDVINEAASPDPHHGEPVFFVDGNEIMMAVDESFWGRPYVVVYRGTKLCPRGGLS